MMKFTTHSEIEFDYNKFSKRDILLEDCVHSLNNQCRFNGHCDPRFSVLQHSCLVHDLMEEQGESVPLKIQGLTHDFSEAYVSDIISPLKELIRSKIDDDFIKNLEHRIIELFYEKYNILKIFDEKSLKYYDQKSFEYEKYYLFNNGFPPEIALSAKLETLYFNQESPNRNWKLLFMKRFEKYV